VERFAINPSAVVPGATVTARQESTGTLVTAVSSEKGQFVFPNLKVGTYTISAELAGFRKSVQTGIVLHVQEGSRSTSGSSSAA